MKQDVYLWLKILLSTDLHVRKAFIDQGQVYNYFMAEYLHSSEEIAPAKKYLSIEILCFFNMKSKAFLKTYLIHETNP